jgi:hypothetical protein
VSPDLVASIHQRLLNQARAEGRPFNEVLQYYGLNRFLYRLGLSAYRERLILKGALMLVAWESPVTRPTRDIDLLGRLDNSPETIVAVIREICAQPVAEDGLRFDPEGIRAERVTEGASYVGVRAQFAAYLGRARIPMQVDVGFGDPLVPGPAWVCLPAVLDIPPAELQGYSRESAIAEKVQAMVALGEINSRMKDFYDIWLLSGLYEFDGAILAQALEATFARRGMGLVLPIVALEGQFANATHEAQWRAFLRRQRLAAPATLQETIGVLAGFLNPLLQALAEDHDYTMHWAPGGPWQ